MLVAVYGSLRQGFGNHNHFLRGYNCLCIFRSKPDYTMYSLGGFPAVVEVGDGAGSEIVYEVYDVNNQTEQALDRLEGVAHDFYYRGSIITPQGTAVIYLMREPPRLAGVVDSGDWAEYRRSN